MRSFEMPSPAKMSRENEIPRATVVVGDDKGRKIKAEIQSIGKSNLAELKFVEEQKGI